MAETIHVRGEGGAVIEMALPLPEGIADRYARGLLKRVNADGSPYTGPDAGAPAQEAPATAGDDGPEPEQPSGRPAQAAPKSAWIDYVVRSGRLSAEDAANYTKADLIEMSS